MTRTWISTRPLILGAAILLSASAAWGQVPKFDGAKLPYRAQWGPYTVVAEKASTEEFSPHRVRILDGAGKVLREIREQNVIDVSFLEITGTGSPELYVYMHSGGAHCCGTEYYFTREGTLRNLLIYHGDNYSIHGAKDLNGDKRAEVIAGSDVLAYFGGLSYAASPGMVMVLGWDGGKYVDQTARYPERSRNLAKQYRADFLKALKSKDEFAEEMRRSAALGYLANSRVAGDGEIARKWLRERAPTSTWRWLAAHEKEIKESIAAAPAKIRFSQDPVLGPKEE
jgi:hypothetical protein